MAILPVPNVNQKLGTSTTDWVGISKIICVEIAFLGSVGVLLFGHPPPDIASQALGIAIATGTTLGVLRITDVVANIVNVRSLLQSPTAQAGGVMPVAQGTPLVAVPATPTSSSDSASAAPTSIATGG